MITYQNTRVDLLSSKSIIAGIEEYALLSLYNIIVKYKDNIESDYNSASDLKPYWVNYPPDDRGRQPRGDQIPWIEVGEHSIGDNLISHIHELGNVRFQGIPAGPDIRYTVEFDESLKMSKSLIGGYWLMADIKSVGPRDNFEHAVMSHNQVSGSGDFDCSSGGILNEVMRARGQRTSHEFHCSLPPFYILPSGKVMLTVTLFIKVIYNMSISDKFFQKLKEIKIGCIPNGLLLSGEEGYLARYPRLLYPGKDDKNKNVKKLRARVDFKILHKIDKWRIKSILF